VTPHRFTLVLLSPRVVSPEFENAVFEAGCDDATIGCRTGIVYLEFDRDAPSVLDAILAAIDEVQSIQGASVAHVEPDDLVTASEIARRTGRTRESVRLLIEGARGPGGFPTPVSGARGKSARVWRWTEVMEWFEAQGFAVGTAPEARVIAAVNGALALSRNADPQARTRILKALLRAS
jgi:hypothetical protein